MRRYSMTKCEEIGDVALLEFAEAGMRTTRARSAAAKATTAEVGRKRKAAACAGELSHSSTSLVQLRRSRKVVIKLDNSKLKKEASCSNDPCASCCSSNGSTELDTETLKFVDLEEENIEISSSTYNYETCRERRETTSSSEIQAESGDLESTARPASEVNSRRRSMDEKMPSSAELEEFFSAAEKDLQKQYAEKYNFDFVKEQPLKGRYNWVRVKP